MRFKIPSKQANVTGLTFEPLVSSSKNNLMLSPDKRELSVESGYTHASSTQKVVMREKSVETWLFKLPGQVEFTVLQSAFSYYRCS